MALKLGDVFIAIGTKDETDRGFDAARRKANTFLRDITQGIAQGLGQAVAHGIGNLISKGIDEIGKAVKAADDLNEAIIRTQKVFDDRAQDIFDWAQTTATALGISERAALNNASSLGSMFLQMGVTREEAARMAKALTEVSVDIATFTNISGGAAQVQEVITAAFRQEYDSLQRVLPAISDAAIVQKALAETGKENAEQLTLQEKNLATYNLILEQATIMHGAFADSVERGTAAQDIFQARIEDARADLGQVGLVIQQEFFRALNLVLDSMGFYGENIVEQLVKGMTQALTALTPFFLELRQVFDVLKPGSPPPLLPELTAWGKAAMEEYLKGWTLADFDSLRAMGNVIESVVRSFAGSGDIKETDLVSRIFGTQRTIHQAIREFRELGEVSEATLGGIADAAGPAGTEVAGLVREYFELQRASQRMVDAQEELNAITRKYDDILAPVDSKLASIRERQDDLNDQQRLEELGEILKDPRAEASDRELARLEIEEIALADHMQDLEAERDTAVDAAQAKIDAAQAEVDAQKARFSIFQQALEQQTQTNALITEEMALRERLADEILAAEEKARRELEAQQRKELATIERIAAAQLGYRLQLADTAGDLEIMREELAKVEEGSAEYFQILTDIDQIEKRLADERAKTDSGDNVITQAGEAALKAKPWMDDFRESFRGVMDALFGPKTEEVKLSPFFQGVVDAIEDIKKAVEQVQPIVQGFIDLFFGGGDEDFDNQLFLPSVSGGTGTGGGGGPFATILRLVKSTINTLQLILDGDWAQLWSNFKSTAIAAMNKQVEDDPENAGVITWIVKDLIPAIDALADGDWATAWEHLGGRAVDAMAKGFANALASNERMRGMMEFAAKFVSGDPIGALLALGRVVTGSKGGLPDTHAQEPGTRGGGSGMFPDTDNDWWNSFLESLKRALPSILPATPGVLDLQSFGGADIAPLSPALAGASTTNINSGNITLLVEQIIGTGGDVGGARAGAETGLTRIRDELINQRLING